MTRWAVGLRSCAQITKYRGLASPLGLSLTYHYPLLGIADDGEDAICIASMHVCIEFLEDVPLALEVIVSSYDARSSKTEGLF